MIIIEEVKHGSPEYNQAVEIRYKALRKPIGLEFTVEQLSSESPYSHFVAKVSGVVAGTMYLVPLNDYEIRVRQFAVDEPFQRQGIGRQLLENAEQIARERGFKTLVLHSRIEAVGFYQSCGFNVVGEPFIEVTLPHIKMVKSVR